MDQTEIRRLKTDDILTCIDIRREVFVEGMGVSEELEVDGKDHESIHFLAINKGEPVGTARARILGSYLKMERLAVLDSVRKKGIAKAIIRAVEQEAMAEGIRNIRLHAQTNVKDLYLNLGYRIVGPVFYEAGIEHVPMEINLVEKGPDVFLAGIIQGSNPEMEIHGQDWRKSVETSFHKHMPQAQVYDHFAMHPEGINYELDMIVETLEEGNTRAESSEIVVCYIPEASMGTAIELYLAHKAGRIVIAITPMTTNWVVRAYTDIIVPDLKTLDELLECGELADLLEKRRRQNFTASTHSTRE